MTTEELEQLMQAHKCGFCVFTCDEGYACELTSAPELGEEVLGHGVGKTVVEAVYEALKSKCGESPVRGGYFVKP